MAKAPVTQEELKASLQYDPATGLFTWLKCLSDRCKPGYAAGTINSNGYVQMRMAGVIYKAHRLAFLYMTGEFPPAQVDHVNHVRDDNRWANLRPVTHAQNGRNAALPSTNTSGTIGVGFFARTNRWCAQITVDGVCKRLGYFRTIEEARAARAKAETLYDFHPNHGK